jgi:predicted phage terminase large subunit-like protein
MAEIRLRLPILHEGQRAVEAAMTPRAVLCCGRRWGKTRYGIHRLFTGPKSLLDPPGYPAAWFAPSSRYVEDVWDELVDRAAGLIEYRNRQSMRMKFITGATLDFWAMGESRDVARGRRYARVIIDEAAHIRYLEDAWNKAVEPTLTDFGGEALFVSTPNGMNFFRTLYQRAGSDPAWSSWTMPSVSNPHLRAEEIESKRADLPELVYAQEYEAQFVTFGAGLVKPDMLIDGPAPPGLPVVIGVDLAISEKQGADYTAITALSRDPSTGIVYVREIERHRCAFNDVLTRVKEAAARWSPAIIAVEQVQYQAAVVQELTRTTRLPVRGVRPDRDKLTRFMPLLTRFEQHQVRIDPSKTPAWAREEMLAFPEGQHDDGVDSLSLAWAALGMVDGAKQLGAHRIAGL